jgi:hypothetical protein
VQTLKIRKSGAWLLVGCTPKSQNLAPRLATRLSVSQADEALRARAKEQPAFVEVSLFKCQKELRLMIQEMEIYHFLKKITGAFAKFQPSELKMNVLSQIP